MNACKKQNIPNILARLTELNMQHSLVTKKKFYTNIYSICCSHIITVFWIKQDRTSPNKSPLSSVTVVMHALVVLVIIQEVDHRVTAPSTAPQINFIKSLETNEFPICQHKL